MRGITRLFLLGWVFLGVAAFPAFGGEICLRNCDVEKCEELECFNGECDDEGRCKCDPCFGGETCLDYHDDYHPYFAKTDETIYIDEGSKGYVYLANAIDDDYFMSCMEVSDKPCPCNKHLYRIVSGTGFSRFIIDESTGQISVEEGVELYAGELYELIISVDSDNSYGEAEILSDDTNPSALMTLRIAVELPYNNELMNIEKYGEESLNSMDNQVRVKRASFGSDRSDVNVSLTVEKTSPEPALPGSSFVFKLTIILPNLPTASDGMDLKVELISLDTETNECIFTLCNVQVLDIGTEIKNNETNTVVAKSDVIMTKYTNTLLPTINDRVTLDFGTLYNADSPGSSGFEPSTIEIQFEALMIVNDDYTASDASITAGAEYDQQSKLHVFQAQIETSNSLDAGQIPYDFTFNGPDTVPQYSGGLFVIDAYVPYPYGKAMVEVSTLSSHDQVSYDSINVNRVGSNHACAPPADSPIFSKSITGFSNYRVQYNYIQMASIDHSNLANEATNEANKIEISFSGFFLAEPDTVVSTLVGLIVEGVVIWTDVGNVTVGAPGTPASGSISGISSSPLDTSNGASPKVGKNQPAVFAVKVDLPRASNVVLTCKATPPDNTHYVSGVAFGETGGNLARLPNMEEIVTYPADGKGEVSWTGNFNTSAAPNGRSADPGQDYVTFDVTVFYATETPGTVVVDCNGQKTNLAAEASGEAVLSNVEGTLTLIGDDPKVYVGSQFAILADIKFLEGGHEIVKLETAGDFDIKAFGAEVCKVELYDAGRGGGAIIGGFSNLQDKMTFEKTSDNSMYLDSAVVTLGQTGSATVTDGGSSVNSIKARVFYHIPAGQTVADVNYTTSMGLLFNKDGQDESIWAANTDVIVSSGEPTYDTNKEVRFTFDEPKEFGADSMIFAKVYSKVYPGHKTTLNLEFTSSSTDDLKICKLAIENIGSNFGCMDTDIYDRDDDPLATSKVTFPDPANTQKAANLNMGIVSNLNPIEIVNAMDIADEDTIEVTAILSFHADSTLTIVGDDGRSSPVTKNIALTASGSATPTGGDLTYEVVGLDGGSPVFYTNAMAEVDLILSFPDGFQKSIEVVTENPNPDKVSLCYAAFILVGQNLPCTDPKLINTTKEVGASGENVFRIPMGLIGQYPVNASELESYAKVRIGVQVEEGETAASFDLKINDGDKEYVAKVDLTHGGEYTANTNISYAGFNMYPLVEEEMEVEPGQTYWVGVKVELPKFATFRLEGGAMVGVEEGHSYASIIDVRWGPDQGSNIGCFKEIEKYPIEYLQNSSIDGTNSLHINDSDTATIDFLYLTNTGVSSLLDKELPEDNMFSFEVEVLIADHDKLADQDTLPVFFVTRVGDKVIAVAETNLTLIRLPSHAPLIYAEFEPTEELKEEYAQGEKIGFTARFRHENGSSMELYDTIARIMVPKYLVFVNSSDAKYTGIEPDTWTSNITALDENKHYIDFHFDFLLFRDFFELNVSFTVDPLKELPLGLELLPSSSLLRLVCKEGGHANPLKYCAPTKFVNFNATGPGCLLDLSIETFDDCQFYGSGAIDVNVGPSKMATADGWSPIVHDPSIWPMWGVIDFLKKTRVRKIDAQQVTGKRLPKTFKLSYSDDGNKFTTACDEILTFDTLLSEECEIIARFMKFEILSTVETDDSIPVGVSLKIYGCYKKKENGTCTLVETPYGDHAKFRQAVVGNGIVYFCELTRNRDEPYCYCSPDGNSWTNLPGYVGSIAGYDSVNDKTYLYDLKESAMVSTSDCVKMGLVSEEEKASLTNLDEPKIIKGSGAQDIGSVDLGSNWKADFTGLKLGNDYKMKWFKCCN